MAVNHLHDLAAYRLCEELARRLEAETSTGAVARDRRFCGQLNDAALDAAADVAEGFARYYPREFARFLDYAIASLAEVRVRTEAGYRRGLFSDPSASDLLNLCARADRACRNLRAYLWTVRREDLPPRPDRTQPPPRSNRRARSTRPVPTATDPDEPS